MNWIIGILSVALAGLAALYVARLYIDTRLRLTVKAALRKADTYKPGGRDHVRIDYNVAAALVNYKGDNYPQRSDKEFKRKPGPHPMYLSPAKRKKLAS